MATGGVSDPDPLPLATAAADRAALHLSTDVTQSWLPQYFTDVLSVELKDVGIFAVMPYLAGVVFDNVWAVLIDHLIASGTLSTTCSPTPTPMRSQPRTPKATPQSLARQRARSTCP